VPGNAKSKLKECHDIGACPTEVSTPV